MKKLILSATIGYNLIQIEFFLKSLRKFYKGKVCFIISSENSELEKKLKDYDFGAPDRSRTHNLRSRNPALYPVEATGAV